MADNVVFQSAAPATPAAGFEVETDEIASGGAVQYVKLMDGTRDGDEEIAGTSANGLEVDVTRVQGNVTAVQATGTNLHVVVDSGTLAVTGPLTDAQLRATPVPVSGTVTAISGTAANLKAEVVGTGTFAAQVTNATAANLKAEVVGTGTFAVQADTELTTADLDTGAGTDTRAVVGLVFGASGGATMVTAAAPLPVTVISGASNTQFAEDAAHTTADVGTQILAKRTDVPAVSSGTDGDYSTVNVDADGRLWVNTGTVRARKLRTNTTITAVTTETTIIAAVASESHDLYGLILTNSGATSTLVTLRDDTAGTAVWIGYVPSLATVGFTLDVNAALIQTAQNKNWTLECGSATSSLRVFAMYVKVT
jgi:hypothetical protein